MCYGTLHSAGLCFVSTTADVFFVRNRSCVARLTTGGVVHCPELSGVRVAARKCFFSFFFREYFVTASACHYQKPIRDDKATSLLMETITGTPFKALSYGRLGIKIWWRCDRPVCRKTGSAASSRVITRDEDFLNGRF